MGQFLSFRPFPQRERTCQNVLPKSLKKLAKSTLCRRLAQDPTLQSAAGDGKTDFHRKNNEYVNNAILPFAQSQLLVHQFAYASSLGNQTKVSKHSLLSYAISKLACFIKLSKHKDPNSKTVLKKKLTFNKSSNLKKHSSKSTSPAKEDSNNNIVHITSVDLNNNPLLKARLIKRLLSKRSSGTTPEETFQKNLDRFEKLLAINAVSSSEAEEDVNNNYCNDKKHRRIITTSKNRVEVDAYFLDWVKSRISQSSNKQADENSSSIGSGSKNNNSISAAAGSSKSKTAALTTPTSTTVSGLKSSRRTTVTNRRVDFTEDSENDESRATTTSKWKQSLFSSAGKTRSATTKTYTTGKTEVITTAASQSRSKTDINNNEKSSSGTKSKSKKDFDKRRDDIEAKRCINQGSCGKGNRPTAPPVYIDYGGGSSVAAGLRRAQKDPVIDRLKNVDVVEELTYQVPNPCGGTVEEGNEEDDCDYYALCESCGEMEPLPEEVKQQIRKKKKSQNPATSDTTPVTYSRRQRFNFKNKNGEGDEDGPPFPYEGLQCPGCRCPCCVAGLRRNPNCGCKCCQKMGSMRRCNSFDEHPVGKNPQIRRILCPDEECKKMREERDKIVPEDSGMYKFEKKENMFERQVPRTPTPIILEVPAPRRLQTKDLQGISKALAEEKCRQQRCVCPVEAEPMYLPPIYGQCNPCSTPCNPCGNGNPCNPCVNPCGNPCNPGANQLNAEQNPATATTYYSYSDYSSSLSSKHGQKKKVRPESSKGKAESSGLQVEDFILHHGHEKSSDSTSLPSA